ncbi:MAG: oxygen-dependent FAD-containing oxidoreductase [Parcubacteria bacterium C7867-005]|nr:MAG: oxygen-dependent FAD-containing oxidoreductase [Parcubacteria bacterium C7867-005]
MLKEEIKKFFKGEVEDSEDILETYSHDASLFVVKPKLVVFPKDASDIENLVKFVSDQKGVDSRLSITIRAAGSCMSGGPLGESIIVDLMRHMNHIGEINRDGTIVEPGVYYRDFEPKTLEKGLILPCYTASKNLNAIGGMIGNNCAGEKTLRYGKMENFVLESKVIFSDGREYEIKPLSREELETKMNQGDFEGNTYKKLFELIESNKQKINEAKPKVSKNSAGYFLWNVVDPERNEGFFDLNKLIVGSQGTLGLVTEAKIKLVPVESKSKLFVIFMRDLTHLADLVNEVLPTTPESVETYDDATMKLAFRFFPEMLRTMKAKNFFKLLLSFIPEAFMMLRGGIPKLIVLVEYAGKSEQEINQKMQNLENKIKHFGFVTRQTKSEEESNKYWTIRRESFSLLRKHVHGSRTAPFIDDVVVEPKHMPEFLPKMRKILDSYKLVYTIAGHAGNGNFHIIPLMDMRNRDNVRVIREVGEKIYNLVAEYGGSITGEHNDGIVRTPYLNKMYSKEILDLFQETKTIFDPQNIFNPGKKVNGSMEYLESHLALE